MDLTATEKEMIELAKKIDPSMPIIFNCESDDDFYQCGTHNTLGGIKLYPKNISSNVDYLQKNNPNIDFHDVYWSLFVHELGHRIDYLKTGFKEYQEANEKIWECVVEGNKDGVKNNFKEYFRNLIKLEEDAWLYAEKILPSTVNKENFFIYKEFCLNSYYNSFAFEYRKFRLKSQICKTIGYFFFNNRDFMLNFDDWGPSFFDTENKIFHANVSNSCKRNRTFIDSTRPYLTKSIDVIDNIFPNYDLYYPFKISSIEEMEIWKINSFAELEDRILELYKYFPINSSFVLEYKNLKTKEIDFIFEAKQNFINKKTLKNIS